MTKRVKFTPEEKYESVKRVLDGKSSLRAEGRKIDVDYKTIGEWVRKYKADGFDGLIESKKWKLYSDELRIKAVESVLSGQYSMAKATEIYNISSKSVLTQWIDKYTGNKKRNNTTSKGKHHLMNRSGRKTTFEERIEIVQFVLSNDKDYMKAVEEYQVSYQQVYSWVKKYEISGHEALQDKRGRNKSVEELTDIEKLNLRIKELEAKNERLEMEVAVQKKLKEIQGRFLR